MTQLVAVRETDQFRRLTSVASVPVCSRRSDEVPDLASFAELENLASDRAASSPVWAELIRAWPYPIAAR